MKKSRTISITMSAVLLIFTCFIFSGCASLGEGLGEAFGGEHGRIIGKSLGHSFDVMGGASAGMTNARPIVVAAPAPAQPVVIVQQQNSIPTEPMLSEESLAPAIVYAEPCYLPRQLLWHIAMIISSMKEIRMVM